MKITLEIPGRLPSWNQLLAMNHWARKKFKDKLQAEFLSVLRAYAADSSTKITSQKNMWSTAADTLVSWQQTQLAKRKLRRAKKKLERKNRNSPASKL